jgi:subtilisin family serine protease
LSPSRQLTGAFVGLLLGAAAATGLPPGPAAAASPAAPAPGTPTGQSITLITGDVVQLAPAGDGRYAATVRPGPDRQNIQFRTTETKDGVRVIPSDAVPMLADGRLDAELFDVQHLIADGYGDTASRTLPLIVQSSGATDTMRTFGSAAGTPLPSIGAVAVQAGKDTLATFWRTQATARKAAAAPRKIWLDGKVKASLDGSAEQIGAPAAWQAGLDGKGVKVAVLDTGADFTHPDLAGRVAGKQDFSGSTDAVDHFGHGTHVAATVAGVGPHPGVAPGAQLLIGKVLGDNGSGDSDMIFRGIQWALDNRAQVISMYLGFDFPGLVKDLTGRGWPADLATSVALEAYRANLRMFDALMAVARGREPFGGGCVLVAAAGNESRRTVDPDYEIAVSIPAAADGVVSVGALGESSGGLQVAPFSNTFPQVSGPGVKVLSAKLGGGLTTMSGTSMATPHVAAVTALWWEELVASDVPLAARATLAKLLATATTAGLAQGVDPADRGLGIVQAP